MRLFRPFAILRWIYFNRLWKVRTKEPVVYLTFDDGPTEELTPFILEVLDKYDAKATFFCVGENAKQRADLMALIRQKGHVIGNHTMSHEKGTNVSFDDYLRSANAASPYTSDHLFRPPYGRLSIRDGRRLKREYRIVMWSWLSYDYDHKLSTQVILSKAKHQLKKGDIIVLHDNAKVEERLRVLLPGILEILKNKGLRSEVISV